MIWLAKILIYLQNMQKSKFTKESSKEELSQALHAGLLDLKDFIRLRFEQINAKLDQKNQEIKN